MKILILGSGAREHTIIQALRRDSEKHDILAAPGNAGISADADIVALNPTNPRVVTDFALSSDIDLVIIGPEAPLVAGVANRLRSAGIPVFGPEREAAALEGSKAFAKDVMASAGVPTGQAWSVETSEELITALDQSEGPYVVKADGLASGKGVLVTDDRQAAIEHAEFYLQHGPVLVEEFLSGPEVSLFFLSDGTRVMPLTPAQDYKRAYDNNEGPNTGGMGAYSPLPWLPKNFVADIQRDVAEPTITELASRGMPFVGLLYCGLILTSEGVKVIEFNARFGDPETQVVLARLSSPLAPLLLAAAQGDLAQVAPPKFSRNVAVTVVLASEGYPDNPHTGRDIHGLGALASHKHVRVAHAGTGFDGLQLLATGGRVLSVVATGRDFDQARERAYAALEKITLEGSFYRRDIAQGVSA
ncbi:MAG: phosphoribosylamine--glycine ligase [Actinobacteria bacterium]|uniref:phosphoribosylamine--glycine ligase n=1 Tax=freshwater metagenome TaxID=449393 RepID=A0A6J6JHN2_9ZZZZ|nr:phosphoribosylamine--glycine ligase [Actinomycetota bacterium]